MLRRNLMKMVLVSPFSFLFRGSTKGSESCSDDVWNKGITLEENIDNRMRRKKNGEEWKFDVNPIEFKCKNCGNPYSLGRRNDGIWMLGCFRRSCENKSPFIYDHSPTSSDYTIYAIGRIFKTFVKTHSTDLIESWDYHYKHKIINSIGYVPHSECNCSICIALRDGKLADG